MAQYEPNDPEELKAQTKALQEKVNEYKQKEQAQEKMKINNCAANTADITEPATSSPLEQVAVQYEPKDTEELIAHTKDLQEKVNQNKQKEQAQEQMTINNCTTNAAAVTNTTVVTKPRSSSPLAGQVTFQNEAVVTKEKVNNSRICLPHPLI
jgi:hypothetical protein